MFKNRRTHPDESERVWTARDDNNDPRLTTSWFQPSNDTIQEQEKLLASTYFLVRQGGEFGERLRCVRCGGRHDYITLMCVEKPITGLANGLYAYYRALKEAVREADLTPQDAVRLQEITVVLRQMPDLSKVHPQMARQVVKDIGPSDMQIGAVSLGVLEGISPTQARRLVDKINERGIRPPYSLNPVTQAEVDRALEYKGLQFTRSRW
jgi:hypothetical protein